MGEMLVRAVMTLVFWFGFLSVMEETVRLKKKAVWEKVTQKHSKYHIWLLVYRNAGNLCETHSRLGVVGLIVWRHIEQFLEVCDL